MILFNRCLSFPYFSIYYPYSISSSRAMPKHIAISLALTPQSSNSCFFPRWHMSYHKNEHDVSSLNAFVVILRTGSSSLLAGATRDGDDLAVDPATVLRGEEADNAGDVLGHGAAAERAVVGHHLLDCCSGDVGGAAGDVVLMWELASFF
jgi:hypothetical protein